MINYKGLKIMVDFYENVKCKCWKKSIIFINQRAFLTVLMALFQVPSSKHSNLKVFWSLSLLREFDPCPPTMHP